MKDKVTTLRASIINSQFTIEIESDQITIDYYHKGAQLQIWINDTCILTATYNPARLTFNYVNLIDIAAKYRDHYYKRKNQEGQKQSQ
jgi:hypothetical protein